jgi:phage terminase large subunit GpA-like protein
VLDCRVYARAAAWIAGADRWTEAKWRDLEDQVGPAPGHTDGNRAGDETSRFTGDIPRGPTGAIRRVDPNWIVVDEGWLD